jgi:pyruvate formate lyase activating enzyme
VYLVVPTLNDSEREIRDLARWVKGHVGTDVPLHFSRFYPQYRLKNLPPTPYETLSRCYQIARAEGLHYVYVGNVPGSPAESTYCPKCGKRLVHREGFRVSEIRIKRGRCQYCQQIIPGLWS